MIVSDDHLTEDLESRRVLKNGVPTGAVQKFLKSNPADVFWVRGKGTKEGMDESLDVRRCAYSHVKL